MSGVNHRYVADQPINCPTCKCIATSRISPTAHYCKHCDRIIEEKELKNEPR